MNEDINKIFIKVVESSSNPMEWIKPVTSIGWSFAFIVLFCEFGATLTEQFEMLNDKLIQSNWYMFSIDVQRMFLMLILNSGKPTFIRGFGNVSCTRVALKKVKRFKTNFIRIY